MQLAPTRLLPEGLESGASDGEAGPSGIQVDALGAVDPNAIGALTAEGGSFGPDLWQGMESQRLLSWLQRLPGETDSAVLRELANRLLLTPATPPRDLADGGSEDALLALRIERLMALGETREVDALTDRLPSREYSESIERARVESALGISQSEKACALVEEKIARHFKRRFWREALIYCQLLHNQDAAVGLALGLMREHGMAPSPAFLDLVEGLRNPDTEALAAPGRLVYGPEEAARWPLYHAMLRASGRHLSRESLVTAAPAILRAVVENSGLPPSERAFAAERAVAIGLLPGRSLARIYEQFAFSAEALASPFQAAAEMYGAEAYALYYQAAARQNLASAAAEILRRALRRAAGEGRYLLTLRALLPLIVAVDPRAELVFFAEDAGRALYVSGRYEQASAWLTLARQESLINPQATAAVAALWPYSKLAGGFALTFDGSTAVWRSARESQGVASERLARQQVLLRVALQALGDTPTVGWAQLAAEGSGESARAPAAADLLASLREAGRGGRTGESVLLSIILLGGSSIHEAQPEVLGAALEALWRVGLEMEARRLAAEVLAANGL